MVGIQEVNSHPTKTLLLLIIAVSGYETSTFLLRKTTQAALRGIFWRAL
jgi:hypothetical protein